MNGKIKATILTLAALYSAPYACVKLIAHLDSNPEIKKGSMTTYANVCEAEWTLKTHCFYKGGDRCSLSSMNFARIGMEIDYRDYDCDGKVDEYELDPTFRKYDDETIYKRTKENEKLFNSIDKKYAEILKKHDLEEKLRKINEPIDPNNYLDD